MTNDLPPSNASVAVITVSYASDSVLPTFLDSVSEASEHAPFVIVVDNKPDPSSHLREDCIGRGVSYLPAADNPGYGGAVNRAADALPASVEWILVSNPDVVLSADAIDRLVDRIRADRRVGSVGPALVNADGSVYPSARSIPSVGNGIGHALFANIWPRNPWTTRYHSANDQDVRPAGWLSGACLLIRRSAFEEIDGFDFGYFMYFEDVDLGFRIGQAGYVNLYDPTITVLHSGAHSTRDNAAAMLTAHHDSARRFLAKRYRGARYAPLRLVLNAGLWFRSLVQARGSAQP
jgi:N-acetylglucosaminyl-diphospho-decaprenol L-rhamnosyltransferase